MLQEWEGVVERIEGDIFVARLRDMTADEVYPGETAELPVGDVSEDDRELLRVGAVFYMTVGYYVWADGRRERFGRVVFRRLPGWTASALERARERARRITRFLRLFLNSLKIKGVLLQEVRRAKKRCGTTNRFFRRQAIRLPISPRLSASQ